jgi:hypothetical protein
MQRNPGLTTDSISLATLGGFLIVCIAMAKHLLAHTGLCSTQPTQSQSQSQSRVGLVLAVCEHAFVITVASAGCLEQVHEGLAAPRAFGQDPMVLGVIGMPHAFTVRPLVSSTHTH